MISIATVAFAERGLAGTSLDDLARQLGVTKQGILYHFGSKNGLITAVVDQAARELAEVLGQASRASEPGWDRVEAIVRAAFDLAVHRPDLLGLLRELGRSGPERTRHAIEALQPLVDAAVAELEAGMGEGRFRRSDPRLVLVSAYAAVTGVVTDLAVLRAVGLELDVRLAARLRRTLLSFLRAALIPGDPPPPSPATRRPRRPRLAPGPGGC